MSEIIKAKGRLKEWPDSTNDHGVIITANGIACGYFIIERQAEIIRSVFKTKKAKLFLRIDLEVRWKDGILELNGVGMDHRAQFTMQEFEDQIKELLRN